MSIVDFTVHVFWILNFTLWDTNRTGNVCEMGDNRQMDEKNLLDTQRYRLEMKCNEINLNKASLVATRNRYILQFLCIQFYISETYVTPLCVCVCVMGKRRKIYCHFGLGIYWELKVIQFEQILIYTWALERYMSL